MCVRVAIPWRTRHDVPTATYPATMPGRPLNHRQVLRDLINMWESELGDPTVTTRVDLPHKVVPIAVYSSTAHAVECAKAVLSLYEASLPVPAVPLIRTLIEDAITAAWLIGTPDGWKSFVSAGAGERATTIRGVMELRPEDLALADRTGELKDLTGVLGTPKK